MKRSFWKVFAVLSGVFVSTAAFAQDGAMQASGMIAIGAGLAIGLATLGGTLAQGKAAFAAFEGISRNPTSRDQIFMPFILALALIELQALLGFIVALNLAGNL